jgi:hypothetical protein
MNTRAISPYGNPGSSQFNMRNPYQSQGLMGSGNNTGIDPVSGLPKSSNPASVSSNIPMPMGMDPQSNTVASSIPMPSSNSVSSNIQMPSGSTNDGSMYSDMTKPSTPAYDPTAGQSSDPSAFNTQYGTAQNVAQYMNPFLQSIMDRGQSALSTWNPQQGTTDKLGAYGLNGYTPGYKQTDRQAATMDNLNAYADPSYQFRLQQGINGLDASAAAKGGLLSSGHMKDLEDYSQGLASTEYQNMYNRFTNDQQNIQNDNNTANQFASGMLNDSYARASGDRNFGQGAYQNDVSNGMGSLQNSQGQFNTDRSYMTNQYNTMNAADTARNQYENNFNADMYKYGNADYEGKLGDYYTQNNGITQTGINASGQSAQNTQDLASALATLGMSAAQIQATIKMAQSGQQAGMIGSGLGLLGTLLA